MDQSCGYQTEFLAKIAQRMKESASKTHPAHDMLDLLQHEPTRSIYSVTSTPAVQEGLIPGHSQATADGTCPLYSSGKFRYSPSHIANVPALPEQSPVLTPPTCSERPSIDLIDRSSSLPIVYAVLTAAVWSYFCLLVYDHIATCLLGHWWLLCARCFVEEWVLWFSSWDGEEQRS